MNMLWYSLALVYYVAKNYYVEPPLMQGTAPISRTPGNVNSCLLELSVLVLCCG